MSVSDMKLCPIEKEFADLGYYEKAKHTRFRYLISVLDNNKRNKIQNMFFNSLEQAVRAVSEIECGDDLVYEISINRDVYMIYIENKGNVAVYYLMPY